MNKNIWGMIIFTSIIIVVFFQSCSYYKIGLMDDYLYVFQVNHVHWLKEIKIDTLCVNNIQKKCEDSLGVKMEKYDCYESNSFKRAIHFLDSKRYYSAKYKKDFKKDYLVILDDNCNMVKITPTIIE
jgi:hypothetical protein